MNVDPSILRIGEWIFIHCANNTRGVVKMCFIIDVPGNLVVFRLCSHQDGAVERREELHKVRIKN